MASSWRDLAHPSTYRSGSIGRSDGQKSTHSGQTTLPKPVSQRDHILRTGMPVSGRWRPHPIGQKRSLGSSPAIVDNSARCAERCHWRTSVWLAINGANASPTCASKPQGRSQTDARVRLNSVTRAAHSHCYEEGEVRPLLSAEKCRRNYN